VEAGEHEIEQGRLAAREAHVRLGEHGQRLDESRAEVGHGCVQLLTETFKPGFGQRVEQRLLISKVLSWRTVAHPNISGELAQRQRLHSAPRELTFGGLEQRGTKISVVIGLAPLSH
jgi:hypothetical protein